MTLWMVDAPLHDFMKFIVTIIVTFFPRWSIASMLLSPSFNGIDSVA